MISDYVFWKSQKFYLKNMKKLISYEQSVTEFKPIVLYQLLNDKEEAKILQKDFKNQETLKLNPRVFKFSQYIRSLEIMLSNFDDNNILFAYYISSLTEDQFQKAIEDGLLKLQIYFID